MNFFLSEKIKTKKFHPKSRYAFGQHLSLKTAYKLMEKYENEQGFKYDFVIKARSDFIFKDKLFYKNVDVYNKSKIEYYGLNNAKMGDNYVHTVALALQHYNLEEQKWKLTPINEYEPHMSIPRDKYNTMRCGDVAVSATRKAAESLFNRWFEGYTDMLLRDIRYNNPTQLQVHRRHDTLQGEIILNNNISAYRIKKGRLHRVAYKNLIKDKWQNHSLILLDKDSTTKREDIRNAMIDFAKADPSYHYQENENI